MPANPSVERTCPGKPGRASHGKCQALMEMASLVENAEQLVKAMGYWPSFHDASVESVERDGGSITITLHLFAMTDEIDPAGYFALEKHHLARFSFDGVIAADLPPGYQSDSLDRLRFERTANGVLAHLESHMDLGGRILSSRVILQSVVPCSPQGALPGARRVPRPDAGSWRGSTQVSCLAKSASVTQAYRESLVAAARGPFFPDREFATLFGLERADVESIADSFSGSTPVTGDVALALNNAMNNLLGYPHGQETAWAQWLSVKPTELQAIYSQWLASGTET